MPLMKGEWLRQGYFVLGNEGLMPAVSRALEQSLQLTKGHFSIHYYPTHMAWRHTYWWREGNDAFAEAQFFAQISKAYPVLSLGAAVEKGYTIAPSGMVVRPEQMMTATWDWHRVLPQLDAVLTEDVPAIAGTLGDVTLRILYEHRWQRPHDGETGAGLELDGVHVCGRHVARAIRRRGQCRHDHGVCAVCRCEARCVSHPAPCVHLDPAAADGLTATQLAHKLAQFDGVRRRLRGLPVADIALV